MTMLNKYEELNLANYVDGNHDKMVFEGAQKEGEEVYNVHLMNQQKMQIQIQIVFGFLKMTEYKYYPV